jgi:hypothetical protein
MLLVVIKWLVYLRHAVLVAVFDYGDVQNLDRELIVLGLSEISNLWLENGFNHSGTLL